MRHPAKLVDDEVRRVGLDSDTEPKPEDVGLDEVDQDVGVLDGNLHRRG